MVRTLNESDSKPLELVTLYMLCIERIIYTKHVKLGPMGHMPCFLALVSI